MAHSWEPSNGDGTSSLDVGEAAASVQAPLDTGSSLGMPLRFGAVVLVMIGLGLAGKSVANIPAELATPARLAVKAEAPPAVALDASPAQPALLDTLTPNSLGTSISREGLVPNRFSRLDPTAICELLDVREAGNAWKKSLVFPGEWECVSMDGRNGGATKRQGDAPREAEASVFTMARGIREGSVGTVRLKISGQNAEQVEAGSQRLSERVIQLFVLVNRPLPESVPVAIRLLHPFEIKEGGTTIKLMKERLEEWRYNVIITFPREPNTIWSGDYGEVVFLSHL